MYVMVTYATVIFVVIAVFYLIYLQRKKIVSFDQGQSTSEDYTVAIKVRDKQFISATRVVEGEAVFSRL